MGKDLRGRTGRRRRGGPHRLVDGERGLHHLPGPPARRRSTQETAVAAGKRRTPRPHRPDEGLGRSRGGLACKIHLTGEVGRRPLALLITPGQWGDAPQFIPVMERIRVGRPGGGHRRTVSGDYNDSHVRSAVARCFSTHTDPLLEEHPVMTRRGWRRTDIHAGPKAGSPNGPGPSPHEQTRRVRSAGQHARPPTFRRRRAPPRPAEAFRQSLPTTTTSSSTVQRRRSALGGLIRTP